MEQYYYAVQNEYSVAEEELKMCMDEQDKIIKSASNFAEFEAYYEESGTTYNEYRRRMKEYSRMQFTIKKLYNAANSDMEMTGLESGPVKISMNIGLISFWMLFIRLQEPIMKRL